jgi:hypothetical protein
VEDAFHACGTAAFEEDEIVRGGGLAEERGAGFGVGDEVDL